jgi:hypothetical protein
MAYVSQHPHRRGFRFDISWLEQANRARTGIDGQWIVSLTFGAVVTLVALAFLVPMMIAVPAP